MNFIQKMMLPFVKAAIVAKIQDPAFEASIIKQAIVSIDAVTDEQKAKIITTVYDAMKSTVIKAIQNF